MRGWTTETCEIADESIRTPTRDAVRGTNMVGEIISFSSVEEVSS